MHCQPCKEQDKTSEACYWCQNCSEALCETCNTFHNAFKLSKDHIVTRYEDHKKQSESGRFDSDEADDFSICSEHPDKTLKYFCKSHGKPVCLTCKRQYHRDTCDVENIEDAITEASINSVSKKFLSSIDERIASFNETKSQKENDLTKDSRIFETALSSLKETREQINVCLDYLEKDVRQKIENQRDLRLAPLEKDVHILTASLENLSGYKNEVQAKLNDASLNTAKRYFHLINMERRCESFYSYSSPIKSVSKSSEHAAIPKLKYRKLLNGIDISIINEKSQENRVVTALNMETKEVGSSVVELEEVPRPRTPRPRTWLERKSKKISINESNNETVTSSLRNSMSINEKYQSPGNETRNVNHRFFRLKSTIKIAGSNEFTRISDIKLMPNKLDIAIAELSQQRVLLYTKVGQKKGHLNVGGKVDSIAVIGDKKIAASLCRRKQIIVVNTDSMVRIHTINFEEDRYVKGLAYFQGNLYANLCNFGLVCMTPSGKELWTDKSLKGDLYFYMDKDGNIFSAKMNSKVILVYSIQNKRHSKYHVDGVNEPMGFTQDKEGNIFVSCCKSHKIFSKFSFNAPATVLLDSSDGIDSPWSIDYDDVNDELLVVNNAGNDIVIFSKTN